MCKPQIGGADLDELAPRSQARQRERWIDTTGDHQVQPRWKVVEQEDHPVLNVASLDGVVVIEHHQDIARERTDFIEKCGKDRFDCGRLGRLQKR